MKVPVSAHENWDEALRAPLEIMPVAVHRPYVGGDRVRRFRNVKSNGDDHWTDEWIGSDILAGNPGPDGQEQGLTMVRGPDGREATLKRLVETFPETMLGPAYAGRYGCRIGVLVKLISLAGAGPVHAHPDASFASRYLGQDHGQAEAWIPLSTDGGGGGPVRAGIGFREGVSREDLILATRSGSTSDLQNLLEQTTVLEGDTWLVRPGLPHFLGAEVFFIEVQEPSDHSVIPEHWAIGADESGATLGLGWDVALDVFDFTSSAVARAVDAARQNPTVLRDNGQTREVRLLEPRAQAPFDIRRLEVADVISVAAGRLSINVITAGDGHIEGEWGRQPVRAGDVYVMPAPLEHHFVAGREPLQVHRCMGPPPD